MLEWLARYVVLHKLFIYLSYRPADILCYWQNVTNFYTIIIHSIISCLLNVQYATGTLRLGLRKEKMLPWLLRYDRCPILGLERWNHQKSASVVQRTEPNDASITETRLYMSRYTQSPVYSSLWYNFHPTNHWMFEPQSAWSNSRQQHCVLSPK